MSDKKTIGERATDIAVAKGKDWFDQAMSVVEKSVINMANQGMFHATIRFEDSLPTDERNQQTFLKRLAQENLKGEFKTIEDGVELLIFWGF
mmetsp:Transcript_31704/g.88846  ORF Transcript_31704/g.88846 Transcript_31704/m.88846 type:complete len:92 (-) Transcript_31704:100-375(-)|eukprot:CAMPEP_0119125586 /NCGR_PEP_ID=MMETSP1310-20130426/4810_1 /TAXON_ID=464262 /ORGANISM="Genus nov. species nov., Strain RCC2339" /LENGTH=91 /DNA_ID=CAMNT_0007115667 /DNA_START=55 /DNA_END=330 /DNA_ORIENTATION=-